ncbi:MAG: hypothetical protein Tsb004_30390 [Allomuricauda sp.]
MEKFEFSVENINFLKKKIESYKGFNISLAKFILELLSGIDFNSVDYEKSSVEIKNDSMKGGFFIVLESKKEQLKIEISLFRDVIEMYVAGEGYPVYDSYTLKERNISKVKSDLKNWLNEKIIRDTIYYQGKIKKDVYSFVDLNGDKNILSKSESLNYFFHKGEKTTTKYPAWCAGGN